MTRSQTPHSGTIGSSFYLGGWPKHEQYLVAATDCELIGYLATDCLKHDAFLRLAEQLRRMADDMGAVIAARGAKEAA